MYMWTLKFFFLLCIFVQGVLSWNIKFRGDSITPEQQKEIEEAFTTAKTALEALFSGEFGRDRAKITATFGPSDLNTLDKIQRFVYYLRKYPTDDLTIQDIVRVKNDDMEFGALVFKDHSFSFKDVGRNERSRHLKGWINTRFFALEKQSRPWALLHSLGHDMGIFKKHKVQYPNYKLPEFSEGINLEITKQLDNSESFIILAYWLLMDQRERATSAESRRTSWGSADSADSTTPLLHKTGTQKKWRLGS